MCLVRDKSCLLGERERARRGGGERGNRGREGRRRVEYGGREGMGFYREIRKPQELLQVNDKENENTTLDLWGVKEGGKGEGSGRYVREGWREGRRRGKGCVRDGWRGMDG